MDESVDRVTDLWGRRTPIERGGSWPPRRDEFLTVGEGEIERWVPSACVLCSFGCGIEVAVSDGRMVGVRGATGDRVNAGRLGPKGLYGWQANHSRERLGSPLLRRGGGLEEVDWDTAMAAVVDRSRELLRDPGPLSLAFYTSGQLFLEEYYALAMIARAGIGTPHLDGNTRLCTATAEWALIESFGADGNPGSYADIEACDGLFLVGHNVAETQTVMWARMLDRLHGPDRPRLVVVDPRQTPAAREAEVHLPVRSGTNVMLLNALLHELVARGWVDEQWVGDHTVGYDQLARLVAEYPPERAADVCGVDVGDIRRTAEILGTCERLVSTVLQGVYQSHQATAAATQVNNIHLLRGMIGKTGATVFQMNGQPTAQNTRETGANGALPVQLNWQNDEHVGRLAAHWNVDPLQLPHWAPPTHVMQILRFCETGSVRFLWVSATNPAASLPELERVRSVLGQERLFLVVQDAFLTETAQLADVVLPSAMWGEKVGTFTNADRTVHLAEKAVDPPVGARTDFEIFSDYAQRMGFTDKGGAPLVKFSSPEQAFDDFKELSRGRPSDYSGLSYDLLRSSGGVQWPCNDHHPHGRERLYQDGQFWTAADRCQSYGHDLETGATNESEEYRAQDPAGRAVIKAAHYTEPHETPTDRYPFTYTTGRTVYHWHTRTKTARAPQLQAAAPDVWIELCPDDAHDLDIGDGDWVRVESPRGHMRARARLSGVRPGVVFAPFHYGYWDLEDQVSKDRAANELTITAWDPVSKQPQFKAAAVAVSKLTEAEAPPPGSR